MPEARRWIALLLLCALVSCTPSEGPAPVAWDRTRCAECGMLVSEPAWAAQRHSSNGEVFHYDDPGCLLVSLETGAESTRDTLYFHHHTRDEWLRGSEVVFSERTNSPMGYDLGAIAHGEDPAGLSLEAARERARGADRARSGP